MAKPNHGQGDISPSSRPHSHVHPVPRPPRFPSPAVLSALAAIATAPYPVAGGPLPSPPPTFLCPSIECNNIDPSPHILATLSPRADISTPLPTITSAPYFSGHQVVADKFVKGSDSLWRKTTSWALYGSTCCSSSTASTSGILSQPSSSHTSIPTSTSTSTSTSSPVQFDTSVLPAGWDTATGSDSTTESTIILALAIVLAGSICVFMIACVFWRKRRKKTRDIERKRAHKLGADHDSPHNAREKDAQGKMRIWARASARWKSNIRQSARRRKKRHVVSSIANRPPSPTWSGSPQVSIVAPSAPSRRASFVSQELDSSTPEVILCLNGSAAEPPTVPHDRPRSVSPPTYGASFVSTFSGLPPSSAASNSTLTSLPDSHHAVRRSDLPSFTEDETLPYIPPSDGHIATDDKAQLAHIRELASSPPTTVDATGEGATQSVSAPEWHEVEDDLENLGVDLSEVPVSFHNFGSPPSFPPPPSMVNVAFGYLDDHSLHYGEGDDILTYPSIPAPSGGPPFGASPSAPPIDDPGLEPSAPSLEGEDDLSQDWDGASSCIPEAPTTANLDCTPTYVIESSISSTASSFPSIREPATRDSILPRYHP